MKKFLSLNIIVMIFLFSGCTVNYNIEIKNNKVNEQIEIIESKEDIIEDLSKRFENEKIYSQYNKSGIKEYKKNKKLKNDKEIYSLKQNYDLMDYKFARSLTECFDAVNLVLNENNNYIFETSKGFKCMIYDYYLIDSYKVNISTDYKVINNNADSVNGNVYTWNINSDNADNKYISMEFEKIDEGIETKDNIQGKSFITLVIVFGSILVLGIIIVFLVNLLKKKNNNL